MLALHIADETTRSRWRVWPDPDSIPPGAIHEKGSYHFELSGSPEAVNTDLLIDDLAIEALRAPGPDMALWRWSPGFHAGVVDAELRIPGSSPRRFEIITDPDRRKLTRDDFDSMVREILDDTFALFSLSSFRTAVARGASAKPPAIARLEFLRSRIEELEEIVTAIVRNPRRRLSAEEVALPYHRAQRATGLEVLRSFRSGRPLAESAKPSRLPAALRGFLPAQIRIRQRLNSLDLAEHRQMGACLRYWASWLNAAADTLERELTGGEVDQRQIAVAWAARCRRLARRISRIATAAPFAEAGDAPAHLMLSAVFRHDPNYRRFYRVWQDMNLGIAAVFGDFLRVPLARTYELYELWCFLRLVRAGTHEFGPSSLETSNLFIADAAGGLTLATGAVTVSIGRGWKLCFQKQYREFWKEPDAQGSFSRSMTPDVVVISESTAAEHTGQLIVLDAKYRIDEGLNDALSSIHTYRDALVQEAATGDVKGIVTAAYLLAPYLPVLGSDYRRTQMPSRLFHPEYRKGFRFGAVTLRPGASIIEIAAALRRVVDDATAGPI
ncbi:hypothetical protein BB934_00125 [Microvirga ossetica]|uniref:DUF2357 domain-containing protein n=1 Tax=Microvirga ossetica TaxID=1882682 RepID=A0A1B2EA28_9HYPH|nr:DUF2357 domain-containing protein [Microvirga ossetica]ANY76821.1 hypothetical protein BB934_00125 [Microvirga ossetica]